MWQCLLQALACARQCCIRMWCIFELKCLIPSAWMPSITQYSWWVCSTEAEVFNLQLAARLWDLLIGWGSGREQLSLLFQSQVWQLCCRNISLASLLSDMVMRFFTWHQNGSVKSWGKILPQGSKKQCCWRELQSNASVWAGDLQGKPSEVREGSEQATCIHPWVPPEREKSHPLNNGCRVFNCLILWIVIALHRNTLKV